MRGWNCPNCPRRKLARYRDDLGLSAYDAGVLAEDRQVADWFDTAVAAGGDPKAMANWIINDLFSLMNESGRTITRWPCSRKTWWLYKGWWMTKTINSSTAQRSTGGGVRHRGCACDGRRATKGWLRFPMRRPSSPSSPEILDENEARCMAYQAGKEKLLGWFVGQVMHATQGKGNPELVRELLRRSLPPGRPEGSTPVHHFRPSCPTITAGFAQHMGQNNHALLRARETELFLEGDGVERRSTFLNRNHAHALFA